MFTFSSQGSGFGVYACIQFYDEGCPNCAWLQIDGDRSRVLGCTSPNFAGFVAIIKPQGSWVARHNKLSMLVYV